MKFKLVILALSLMATQSICSAQQVEKNGLPCVAELCLGDGLAELSKVHWDRAHNGYFDSKTLTSLARVTVACTPNERFGTYTTQSGNPTRVSIALIPNQTDTTKHQWTVHQFRARFPLSYLTSK